MNWFNYYGLAVMAVIMIPNIIYAVKHKTAKINTAIKQLKSWNKSVDTAVLLL